MISLSKICIGGNIKSSGTITPYGVKIVGLGCGNGITDIACKKRTVKIKIVMVKRIIEKRTGSAPGKSRSSRI